MGGGASRAGDWVHVVLWDQPLDPLVRHTLKGLDPLSVYEVSLHAHNEAGRSDEAALFRFRTIEGG